jgi:hypothetical protein
MAVGLPIFFKILSGWVDQAIFLPKFDRIGRFGFCGLKISYRRICLMVMIERIMANKECRLVQVLFFSQKLGNK